MEKPVRLAHLDPLESLVPLGHQEREGLMDQQGLREDKERKEPRESLAWKVLKERQVPLALRDHLASPVLKDSGGSQAQLESKGYLVLQAQMDLLDLWALLVYLV